MDEALETAIIVAAALAIGTGFGLYIAAVLAGALEVAAPINVRTPVFIHVEDNTRSVATITIVNNYDRDAMIIGIHVPGTDIIYTFDDFRERVRIVSGAFLVADGVVVPAGRTATIEVVIDRTWVPGTELVIELYVGRGASYYVHPVYARVKA